MDQKRIIVLASSSPRRKELLEKIGLTFTVDSIDYPEDLSGVLKPDGLAKMLSMGKAMSVAKKYSDALIIAADTFGVFRGRILGKPHTAEAARQMLTQLSGKAHTVITGFTIFDTKTNKLVTHTVETRVHFRELTPQEIDNYVKSGEPLDKAGAYAIQGFGSTIVDKIEGDFYNVVGLPLCALSEKLKEFGINVI